MLYDSTNPFLSGNYAPYREECDEFALASQERALGAQSDGYFAEEIVAVDVPGPRGSTIRVEKDEGPRAGLTMEKLAKLPARFVENGVVTPGNASARLASMKRMRSSVLALSKNQRVAGSVTV